MIFVRCYDDNYDDSNTLIVCLDLLLSGPTKVIVTTYMIKYNWRQGGTTYLVYLVLVPGTLVPLPYRYHDRTKAHDDELCKIHGVWPVTSTLGWFCRNPILPGTGRRSRLQIQTTNYLVPWYLVPVHRIFCSGMSQWLGTSSRSLVINRYKLI